jgi:hypothetical protein
MYISLHYCRENKVEKGFALQFLDDNTVLSSVRSSLTPLFPCPTNLSSQENLCELCAKAGMYRCMKGKRMSDKAADKCPVCIRAQQSCKPSSKTRELPTLGASHIPADLFLVPQRDHRYGFFRLYDPRYQVEHPIEDALHGAKVSLSVPLANYDPRNNHWRPLPLEKTDDEDPAEDDSRFLPDPDDFPSDELQRYGIVPEGPVRPYKVHAPHHSPAAGPSKPKTSAKSSSKRKLSPPAAPETSEEGTRASKRRRVARVPRDDIPAGLPTTHRSLLLPVSPAVLLSEFKSPTELGEPQRDIIGGVLRELAAISGTLSSVAASWNTLISDLHALGQRYDFDGNLPAVFMHYRPPVEWEETPVDPRDRKGKKPAWRKKGKMRRGDKSALEGDPVPESDEDPREDEDEGGPPGGGSVDGDAMVEG